MLQELRERLKKLANIESTYPHILTAYLRVREGGHDRRKECRIFAKNRAAEIEQALSGDSRARAGLKRELAVLDHVIEQDIPQDVSGLALFVRGGEVIERFDTHLPFQDQLAYRRVPHVAQLAFMEEEFEPFLVVSVDSRSAKIFDVALGMVSDPKATVQSEVHRRIQCGGWSQMRYQRHIDNQKREHLDDVVTQVAKLVHRLGYKRVMLVGPDKTTSQLLEMLPPGVKRRVIERKSLGNHQSDKQVIDEALAYFAKAESEEEAEKIRRLRIELHSSGMGVAGIDNVLRCLNRGQIYELMLVHDFNEKGVECEECGAISHGLRSHTGKCPACDAPKEKLKDVELREVLTRRSLQYGFKIEFVKLPEFASTFGAAGALLYSPNA